MTQLITVRPGCCFVPRSEIVEAVGGLLQGQSPRQAMRAEQRHTAVGVDPMGGFLDRLSTVDGVLA
ncbi:hypothetical protein [Streptomyces griseoflavus]|uniref:hypothetical protein n=1 Tax=Streptomyces griseoflavus TaxID=35619 RepID=UPI0001B4BE18|nr:hypothetical protein [Streptomyces griseoflavus]